ncbi:C-type lectin-like [Mercenaria mercenaria]|uniref:C-type lectin-like n=1 Tax=Mercenaria mercenaria TaxID=6596 RepID=UPI00234EC08D|nr:C-type lectin-like [Mercenaria mercenaria]
MSTFGLTLFLLSLSVCIGHESYNAEEMLKKVVEILNLLVKDKKCSTAGEVCPDGWLHYRGSCYLFPNGNLTFTFNDAEYFCNQHGSHLVHIESESENTFLKYQMRERKDSSYWTGLTDPNSKRIWTWHNSETEASFTDWSRHSPNNYDGNQYCVFMELAYNFQWNDFACENKFRAVCEKDSTGPV